MTPDFLTFWQSYPRRVCKADAWKAWQQTAHDRPPMPELLAKVAAYRHWLDKLAASRQFAPAYAYPASWLRAARWEDEYDAGPAQAPAAPVVSPEEQERRQAERMAAARARGAWSDVMLAMERRSLPLGGWPEARTARALDAVGGFDALCRAPTRAALHALGLSFERAYVAEMVPATVPAAKTG